VQTARDRLDLRLLLSQSNSPNGNISAECDNGKPYTVYYVPADGSYSVAAGGWMTNVGGNLAVPLTVGITIKDQTGAVIAASQVITSKEVIRTGSTAHLPPINQRNVLLKAGQQLYVLVSITFPGQTAKLYFNCAWQMGSE
jgi:hypothetical protein